MPSLSLRSALLLAGVAVGVSAGPALAQSYDDYDGRPAYGGPDYAPRGYGYAPGYAAPRGYGGYASNGDEPGYGQSGYAQPGYGQAPSSADIGSDAPPPVARKHRRKKAASATVSQSAEAATPWAGMPTFDSGSLDRLNGLSQRYAAIARSGGFPAAPPSGLGQGSRGPGVLLLRQRLAMDGDLDQAAASVPTWDNGLTTALKHFQMRYGFQPSGRVDARTRAAMAVPVDRRLDQIGRNMERLGSRFIDFGSSRYVVVNIPSAQAEAIENGRVVRRYTAVAGKPSSPSPQVDATITAVNINPTWTLPWSIIKKEIAPHVAADPGYLDRQRMRVMDFQGNELSPSEVNWRSDKAIFTVRQDAGLGNALGQLRIQMPNTEAVYMHDTPSKALFGASERFFSHGCVRVQGVNDLAAWLMGPDWDQSRVKQEIDSEQSEDLPVAQPTPVHWVYMTVYVTADGSAHFRDDPYKLDSGAASTLATAQ